MSTLAFGQLGPMSSGEIPINDPKRSADVDAKHQQVSDFLDSHDYDGLLLQKSSNFAWFTSGADCTRFGSSETTAALFITRDARVVMTSNADSPQLFDRELPGLGFQLKERAWHEPRANLVEDICRGRTVASDTGFRQTADATVQLTSMRTPLTALERKRYRELGQQVAHAVEATARHLKPGVTESEVAGELAHRLIKHEVIPERIQVWADGQAQRYPRWRYGNDPVERHCIVSAIGRRWGLNVGAARTICFGEPPSVLADAHYRTVLAQATGMFFSQPDWELFEIWNRVRRIYEKYGCGHEWQKSDQAELIGYEVNEMPIVPKSEFRLSPGMPVYWHPSVGPAVAGDTILVTDDGIELVTPADDWPRLKVWVKGEFLFRPDILQMDV